MIRLDLRGDGERLLRERGAARARGVVPTEAAAAALDAQRRGALHVAPIPVAELRERAAWVDPEIVGTLEYAAKSLQARAVALSETSTAGGRVRSRLEPWESIALVVAAGPRARVLGVAGDLAVAAAEGVRRRVVVAEPAPDGGVAPLLAAAALVGGATEVHLAPTAAATAACLLGAPACPRTARAFLPWDADAHSVADGASTDTAWARAAAPSDLAILADSDSDPWRLARELVAACEDDPTGAPLCLALGRHASETLPEAVDAELRRCPSPAATAALAAHGAVVAIDDMDQALAFVARWRPARLWLDADPAAAAGVRGASVVYAGTWCPPSAAEDAVVGAPRDPRGRRITVAGMDARWLLREGPRLAKLATAAGRPACARAIEARIADAVEVPSRPPAAESWVAPALRARRLPPPMPPAPEDARLDVPGGALDWPDPLKLRLCAVAAELRFGAPGGESRVELESALASRSATDAFGVLLGASAAELMAAVLRATVSPGQIVAAPASSGGALAAAIAQAGARVREIPSAADPPFAIDVERAMAEAHGAQVVVLASPDLWTGAIVHPGLVRLLEINGEALLLLDETEQPWSGQDWSAFVGSGRVAIVRALGPALGHAALPLAYLLAPPALVAEVRKLVDASAINSLAVAAARIALEEPGFADARAHAVRDEKERLALALEAIRRTVVRGSGSFVLIASDEPAREYRDLRRAGVCVGEPSGPPGYLRVYAGTAEDGDRLVAALARQS